MNESPSPSLPHDPAVELIAGIKQAGVEVDDSAALAWFAAVSGASGAPSGFVISEQGFGGHHLAILDFDASSASRISHLGQLVATPPDAAIQPALAIAGSAAQSRFQPYPGDFDFFERLNIVAPDRPTACQHLAAALRATVVRLQGHEAFVLEEVVFGALPATVPVSPARWHGSSLVWLMEDVLAGQISLNVGHAADPPTMSWADAAAEPTFVKIDWVLIDSDHGGPARVTKVIDATWQRPDGQIVSLDTAIDPDFQQVYLSAGGATVASRLAGLTAPSDRRSYVAAMESEIAAYAATRPPNYGKVAKRLYNVSRLTGQHAEALFIRELLNDAPARLYQARARLEVIAVIAEREPTAAISSLRDLTALLAVEQIGDAVFPVLDDPLTAMEIPGVIATLDRVLQEQINLAFERLLLGYPPVAQLIDDILKRVARDQR